MATIRKTQQYQMCKGHNSPILMCSGEKSMDDFYTSWSDFSNGKVPYCKDCCVKIWEHFSENCKTDGALYYSCQLLDIPFIKEVYEQIYNESIEGKKEKISLKKYIGRLLANKTKSDYWKGFANTNIDISEIDNKLKTRLVKQQQLDQFILDWGDNKDTPDYELLDKLFLKYTSGEELQPAEETLYRKLCLVELASRKKDESGESTKEEQKMIIDLMDKLKLTTFQDRKKKSKDDLMLEARIFEIEETKPCELIDVETYKDYLNIKSDWGSHIMRAVKNLIAGTKDYPNISRDD